MNVGDMLIPSVLLDALFQRGYVDFSPAYYYGKKKSKRVGRPPGGHTNLDSGVKRRGRRRKRRKQLFVHKKRRSSASVDNTPAGSPQVDVHFLHQAKF